MPPSYWKQLDGIELSSNTEDTFIENVKKKKQPVLSLAFYISQQERHTSPIQKNSLIVAIKEAQFKKAIWKGPLTFDSYH